MAYLADSKSFDNFLYGMALANHTTYLKANWSQSNGRVHRVVAYLAGMGEHLLYILFKINTAVVFIFLNIGLTLHYLIAYIQNCEEREITERKIRLNVAFLVLMETFPGVCIDLVGMIYPPIAYRVHEYVKERVTRRYFEKWGVIDYEMGVEEFAALNYFDRM